MFIKYLLISLVACILLFATFLSRAQTPNTTLVLDMRNIPELPRNFRIASEPSKTTKKIDATGLDELYIAGGAQFSKLGLQKILAKLNTKHITVIDLRQEPHGFLNGNAVSWYADNNAINENKTDAQIEKEQAALLDKLIQQESVEVSSIIKKSAAGEIEKSKLVEFSVHEVATESKLVTFTHNQYERLYVQDYHAPNDEQVDRFIQIIKHQPPKKWIYLHCRAGVGRTSTFMAMYDMMRSAKQVSFEDILARQAEMGGKDLAELPEKDSRKYTDAVERLEFLKKFYHYARQNDDDFATGWSKWMRESKVI